MRRRFRVNQKKVSLYSFSKFIDPGLKLIELAPKLESNCNKPIEYTFEDQFRSLIYYHLDSFSSGRDFIQTVNENQIVQQVTSLSCLKKSTFFEANSSRGLDQLMFIFEKLVQQSIGKLPKAYEKLGQLVAIDGSLIDASMSMNWADYRKRSKKAKVHLGYDVNRGVPRKLFISTGKSDERPFTDMILDKNQTGIMDRYYQHHQYFDKWQRDEKQFACRIKSNTIKELVEEFETDSDSIVFYDAIVHLGFKYSTRTELPLRVVGYNIDGVKYWVATNRYDLTAEEIALIYKLRWQIEAFFGWWKQHLKVYHIISRDEYGFKVQLMAGLITYLLLSLYCRKQYNQHVCINLVRRLRNQIINEQIRCKPDEKPLFKQSRDYFRVFAMF